MLAQRAVTMEQAIQIVPQVKVGLATQALFHLLNRLFQVEVRALHLQRPLHKVKDNQANQ
ncbi:MAG: hypothetical protein CME31_24415 [Gimesia sp.]|nr:hypothetical protein [Gimesia sp.]